MLNMRMCLTFLPEKDRPRCSNSRALVKTVPRDPRDNFINVMPALIASEIGASDWRFVNELGTRTDVELISNSVAHVRSEYRTKLSQWGDPPLEYQAKVEKIGDKYFMRCLC